MCAQSSGPSCWQSLKGSRPCLPPEGSWGVADGAAARQPLHRRSRWRPRPPAVATIPGGLERPLHQTRPPQGRPRPASLELRHAAVRSRTWPQLGPRRGLALRGRRQGRRGLACRSARSRRSCRSSRRLAPSAGSRTGIDSKTGFGIAWGEVRELVAIAHHAPKIRRDAWKWLSVIGDFHPFSVVVASLRKPCAETVMIRI